MPHPVNMSGAISRRTTAGMCSSATIRDHSAWPMVEDAERTWRFCPSSAMA